MQKIKFMYKFSNNNLPAYLYDEIPVSINTEYNLRNKDNIRMPKSKKNYYLKSYIPSSIKIWNDTEPDIKNAETESILKSKLMRIYGNSSNALFLYGDGKGAINQSRIRMGLSALNSQRKKYHFIPDGTCPNCDARSEDAMHFLLVCPAYTVQRQQLFQELNHNVPQVIHPLSNFTADKKVANMLTRILINGTGNAASDQSIFKSVHIFIETSQRF